MNGQRHRECGCFCHSWDLNARCARHWEIGDCVFYQTDFALGPIMCSVCESWTLTQWKAIAKSRTFSSRKRVNNSVLMSSSSASNMSDKSPNKLTKKRKQKLRTSDSNLKPTSADKIFSENISEVVEKLPQPSVMKAGPLPAIVIPSPELAEAESLPEEPAASFKNLQKELLEAAYGVYMEQQNKQALIHGIRSPLANRIPSSSRRVNSRRPPSRSSLVSTTRTVPSPC
jgi:hypothetical protein